MTLGRRKTDKYYPGGFWRPISGYSGSGFIDHFQAQREPSKLDLISSYEDTIFSCANLVSQNIAVTPLRLYVQTDSGHLPPKCRTKSLTTSEKRKLEKSPVRSLKVRKAKDYSEVVEHPLLDLLFKPSPTFNWFDLITLTELYLEISGNAYWRIKTNELGQPAEIIVLPAYLVTPLPNLSDLTQVRGYEYVAGYGSSDKVIYSPDEIVHFSFPDLYNPYLNGMPPVRAIWERNLLSKKEMSMMGAVLSNCARMDGIISPKEPMGAYEADRLSREITQRFRGAGSGGWFVTPEEMGVTPLNWMPKDLSGLQVYQVIKIAVCNAFGVPPTLFESGSNRAEKESDQYYLARYSLVPRLIRIAHKVNERLCPYYSERLWLEFDDPVPESQEEELARRAADLAEATALLQNGVMIRDEARVKYGLPSEDWAREPLVLGNMVPAVQEEENDIDLSAFTLPETKPDYTAQVVALQAAYYAGTQPRSACISSATILFGYSQADAEALFPELPDSQADEPATVPADAETPGEAEDASNALRATVGGSAQVMALQAAYYAGTIPRDAAIGNLVVMFGFSQAEAELLLPPLPPDPPANTDGTSPGMATETTPEASGSVEDEPGPMGEGSADDASEGPSGAVLDVPDIRQQENWDCGPAATMAVCRFLGTGPETEQEYVDGMGTTEEGTSPAQIVGYLRSLDLAVEEGEGKSLDDLATYTASGKPVICAVKAGKSGHWVVVCGVEADTVHVHDPLSGRVTVQADDFVRDWRDGSYSHYGIAVGPKLDASQADDKQGEKAVRHEAACKCYQCKPVDRKSLGKAGKRIEKVLRKYFRVQRQQVLDRIGGEKAVTNKADPWKVSVDLTGWNGPMAKELMPIVLMSAEEGVFKTIQRLGDPSGLMPVVQPKLKEALEAATMEFCDETNRTTSLQLEAARQKLREELGEGITAGEQRNELRKRVQEVFDHADDDRALRIAVTEESRSRHQGQMITAQESGMVRGFKLLISSNPCPVCEQIGRDRPEIKLGEVWHNDGKGTGYSESSFPPFHPNCQCGMNEVLNDE